MIANSPVHRATFLASSRRDIEPEKSLFSDNLRAWRNKGLVLTTLENLSIVSPVQANIVPLFVYFSSILSHSNGLLTVHVVVLLGSIISLLKSKREERLKLEVYIKNNPTNTSTKNTQEKIYFMNLIYYLLKISSIASSIASTVSCTSTTITYSAITIGCNIWITTHESYSTTWCYSFECIPLSPWHRRNKESCRRVTHNCTSIKCINCIVTSYLPAIINIIDGLGLIRIVYSESYETESEDIETYLERRFHSTKLDIWDYIWIRHRSKRNTAIWSKIYWIFIFLCESMYYSRLSSNHTGALVRMSGLYSMITG